MPEIKWHHRHLPRNVEGLVEQQVRRWQFQPNDEAQLFWPVVTISRESGTLGLALGRRIAQRLGFEFWDQEIVTTVAQQLHVDPSQLLALDEHAPGRMEAILTALRSDQGRLATSYFDQLKLLLVSIGHHGRAVIVGRGAHCAIRMDHALRVRLVAPLEKRIADYEARCNASHEEAIRQVSAGDRERNEFVRRVYHTEVADPTQYDLVLNVATFDPERADAVVLMAYLAKFGQLPAEARDSAWPERADSMPAEAFGDMH